MPREPRPLAERLWEKIDLRGSDECWLWLAAKSDGYGKISTAAPRRTLRAHRVAYELLVGPVPDGLQLDHLCRNRACCNPAHMEPVTRRENLVRGEGFAAKCAAATHCPHGHPYDEENTYRCRKGRHCRACKRRRDREYYWRRKAEGSNGRVDAERVRDERFGADAPW